MRRDSNTNTALTRSNRRRISERAAHPTISIESLHKRLDDLHAKAVCGEYQAQFRLETVSKLVDPCLEFCESDVQRARNKGYPPQVQRGLKLYRMMSRLTTLCEPIGDTIGVACRVRLINFEALTWAEFLDIKSHTLALVSRGADKRKTSEQFNGLELLTPEEKDLYERAKRYFGGRKRPTLKSLALDLLGQEGEVFVDRSASNHLAAVREFRERHKDGLGFSWYFIGSVDSYNKNPMSVREFYAESVSAIGKAISGVVIPDYSRAIGEAIVGVYEQAMRSQRWVGEIAKCLLNAREQSEGAIKFAANAIAGITRVPRITLPNIYFRDNVI